MVLGSKSMEDSVSRQRSDKPRDETATILNERKVAFIVLHA